MVNVETDDIFLPRDRVGGAKRLRAGNVYATGSTLATGRALQELRGYYIHRPIEDTHWKALSIQVEVLLGFLDTEEIWIHGAGAEIWSSFCHTAAWLRGQMERGGGRNHLFRGSLFRRPPLLGRFSGPHGATPVTWLSPDAALTRIGAKD